MADSTIGVIGDDEADSNFFSRVPELKLLIRWGAGMDNVAIDEAIAHGVIVKNTPGLFGEDVADMAFGLAMNLVRQITDKHMKILQGGWPKSTTHSFRSLRSGILGVGAIGREIARLTASFGLETHGYDPGLSDYSQPGLEMVPRLPQLLRQSNILFITAPLTPDTEGLISANEIRRMLEPRFVVNVSRGEVLDQSSAFELVDSGELDGLGLDVYWEEPSNKDSFPRDVNKCVFSSHNASNTFHSIAKANQTADQLILEFLQGRQGDG